MLALGVLILSAASWVRFFLALSLPDLPLSVPVWYLALVGVLWGVTALVTAIGLLIGRSWASWITRWGGVAYVIWMGLDRLLLARSDYAVRTRPFELAVSLALLGCAWWILHSPSSREYFRKRSI
jgi:hypothetical protein